MFLLSFILKAPYFAHKHRAADSQPDRNQAVGSGASAPPRGTGTGPKTPDKARSHQKARGSVPPDIKGPFPGEG